MTRHPSFETEQFDKGLEVRRAVLGPEYVDASVNRATDATAPLQKLVTEWCWGEIWTRPGLDRRSRSLLNLGMLCALNRPHELRLHVRGALNNGLTRAEIAEAVLQAAIYCGVPAALDAQRVVQDTFAEIDAETTA